jgi:hypothetical protein
MTITIPVIAADGAQSTVTVANPVVVASSTAWPGQPGNLVGYAATPAVAPASYTGSSWPGAWPGSFTGGVQNHPTFVAGKTYAFCDFENGSGGLIISATNMTFIGCRFLSNNTENENTTASGSGCKFFYCTWGPTSPAAPPKGWTWPAWRSTLTLGNPDATVQDSGSHSMQYGIRISTSGLNLLFDHSEIWDFANAVDPHGGDWTFQDCWIHDARNASTFGDHTDGIVDTTSQAHSPPWNNVTIHHCTVASIGNTMGIGTQAPGSGNFNNWKITNNYISGWGGSAELCLSGMSGGTGIVVTDNVWTDALWIDLALVSNLPSFASGSGNTWARNTFVVVDGRQSSDPNLAFHFTASDSGKFVLPTSPGVLSATDYTG